jgi:ABC-type multidrug transport system fused ATPase/permease subunit
VATFAHCSLYVSRHGFLGTGNLECFFIKLGRLLTIRHIAQLLHYGALKLEASPRLKDDPGAEWPSNGRVTFDKVDLRYRPSLPLVLKRVSFGILPGEKVSDLANV